MSSVALSFSVLVRAMLYWINKWLLILLINVPITKISRSSCLRSTKYYSFDLLFSLEACLPHLWKLNSVFNLDLSVCSLMYTLNFPLRLTCMNITRIFLCDIRNSSLTDVYFQFMRFSDRFRKEVSMLIRHFPLTVNPSKVKLSI